MNESTKDIYNENAHLWERREPNSLSDFTGRPPVFDLCSDVDKYTWQTIGSSYLPGELTAAFLWGNWRQPKILLKCV